MALRGAQAEWAVSESGELLQEIVEFLPEAIFRTDADLQLVYANSVALEMIGVTSDDLDKGLSLLDFVDEADRSQFARRVGELGLGRRFNPTVFKARRSDGASLFIEAVAAPIFGKSGELTGLWGAGRNVTERVQADRLSSIINGLRLSLAATSDLQEALEQVLDAALLLDGLDSGCVYARDPGSGLMVLAAPRGLSAEFVEAVRSFESSDFHMELVSESGEGKVAHFTREQIGSWPTASAHSKEGLRASATLPMMDKGLLSLFMAVSSHTLDEIPASTVAGLQELALQLKSPIARIRAEEARREVVQTLEGLLAAAPLAIYCLDLEGKVTTWNAAAEKMFGWSESEMLGSRLPYVSAGTLHELLDAAAAGGTLEPLELERVRKDGSPIFLRVARSLLRDHRGCLLGHVCVTEDVTDRRHLEESLRVTQFCVDRAKDMIFWTDPAGHFRYVSESTYRCLGYSSEEMLGMTIAEVDPNAQRVPAKPGMNQTDGAKTFESVYRTKTGEEFPVEVSVNYAEYEGEVFHFVFARDITERKQAEEGLRESEERLRLALSAAGQGLWDLNPQTGEGYASPELASLLGYRPEEFVNSSEAWESRIHPDDFKEAKAQFEACLTGENADHACEYRTRTPSGEWKWVLDQGRVVERDPSGRAVRVIGTTRDITARKQAEEHLHLTQFSVDRAADPIYWLDSQGRIILANEASCRRDGYSREEMLSRTICDLDPNLTPDFYRAWWRDLKQAGSLTVESAHRTRSGELYPIEVSANYIEQGGREYNCVFARDITERKKAEQELQAAGARAEAANKELEHAIHRANQLAVEAQAANEAKSLFLANMSHEIRTPMNGVIGMIGLLLDTDLTTEQREYAETVTSSANALLGLIGDILDFSKVEAHKLELETIDFDLRSMLEDMTGLLALRAQEKGVELATLIEPGVPSVLRGDPGRLRQVLTNLVGNSIKFTESGEINLLVQLDENGTGNGVIRFAVRDTGCGVSQDKVDALFQPFTQADASTTRRHGGTGLGLSISKALVEMMGGSIHAESEPGVGSTFWFTLPVVEGSPEGLPIEAYEPAAVAGTRVLGVDDNETNRKVLAGMLASWDCRHVEVSSAAAALEALRQGVAEKDPFRIAILDLCMPEVDGEALALAIKADPDLRDTSLVLMSSIGARGDAARMEKLGFSAYLVKPVRQSRLYDCLASVLGRCSEPRSDARSNGPIITRHTLAEQAKRRVRILLAEDNPVNQKVALKILEKLGYRADVASDGIEALEALRTKPYDLVLMDVQIPGMDGLEVTRRVRSSESGATDPRVPIIALTAHAMEGDRKTCLDAGMDDYLVKPIKPGDLSDVLARWAVAAGTEPSGAIRKPLAREQAAAAGASSERGLDADCRVFDERVLLRLLDGDRASAAEIASGYLADVPSQISAVRAALEMGDAVEVRCRAHALKGSSANVGADCLRRLAAALDEGAAVGDLDGAGSLVASMERQLVLLQERATLNGGLL